MGPEVPSSYLSWMAKRRVKSALSHFMNRALSAAALNRAVSRHRGECQGFPCFNEVLRLFQNDPAYLRR
jgi:hypothetical protein